MKIDLGSIFNELKLPLTLIALFSAVLGMFGLELDQVLNVAGSLVGVAAAITLTINVLKYAGVVDDGWAGKVSGILNLVALVGIAGVLKVNPAFDFAGMDAQVAEFVKTATVLFAYVVQISTSKGAQGFLARGLGIRAMSHSAD